MGGGQYAAKTEVPVERSRAELERTLSKYGATRFAYGWRDEAGEQARVVVGFRIAAIDVSMTVPMPKRSERRFTHHSRGVRTPTAAEEAYEQACRARWRALTLVVRAKLEAVEIGLSTVEREFLAETVVPDGSGRTVYDVIAEPLAQVRERGTRLMVEAAR